MDEKVRGERVCGDADIRVRAQEVEIQPCGATRGRGQQVVERRMFALRDRRALRQPALLADVDHVGVVVCLVRRFTERIERAVGEAEHEPEEQQEREARAPVTVSVESGHGWASRTGTRASVSASPAAPSAVCTVNRSPVCASYSSRLSV